MSPVLAAGTIDLTSGKTPVQSLADARSTLILLTHPLLAVRQDQP
jgi:hypothetical protein